MRRLLTLSLLALIVLLGLGRLDGLPFGLGGDDERDRRSARVVRVVDGDTVVLSGVGTARLIGVDTPEVHGGTECFGPAASRFAERVLHRGRRVRYRLGADPRDRYGRALVDVWLADGRHVNAMLVRDGFAEPLRIAPNVTYARRLERLAGRARRARRGLWGACR